MTKSYFKNQGVLKAVNLAESEVSSEHCPCSMIKTLINTRILLQASEHLGFIVCEVFYFVLVYKVKWFLSVYIPIIMPYMTGSRKRNSPKFIQKKNKQTNT